VAYAAAFVFFVHFMRTYIYIDGFNFYHSAIEGKPYKWLDFKSLFTRILESKNKIECIKYFTARVDGKDDPDKPLRQDIYLRALKTYIPELSLYFGNFSTHRVWKRLVTPSGNQKSVCVFDRKEKGSDVKLAVHLLNDAWLNKFDCAVIVSNDSDLEEAIKIVKNDRNKIIGWVIYDSADSNYRPSKVLRRYANFIKHITESSLKSSQLPDPIPGTTIRKPSTW